MVAPASSCNTKYQPWLIWGDFNLMLTFQDRLYGNTVTSNEIQDFTNCMQCLNLSELPCKREYYTWSNKQEGLDRVIA